MELDQIVFGPLASKYHRLVARALKINVKEWNEEKLTEEDLKERARIYSELDQLEELMDTKLYRSFCGKS